LGIELRDAPRVASWSDPLVDDALMIGEGDDPTFTADRLQFYFNDAGGQDILRRTRATVGSAWSPATLVVELNSTSSETTPEVSSDGLTITLGSTRSGALGGYDIMVATRASRSDTWSTPTFDVLLNSPYNDNAATFSADQTIAVFRTGRNGTDDLWFGTRPSSKTGAWTVAALGLLSSGTGDNAPQLAPDGLTLYFASDRSGDYDLYESHRSSTTELFRTATPMMSVNTTTNENDPWVSPDGRHLYFMRGATPATVQLMHSTLIP